MVGIVEWLGEIGLGRYAQAFVSNDIDFEVLSDLTDADLEELGLTLGHRKKLRRAIARLPEAPSETRGPVISGDAERRQLTVMFCDLVGSTALASKLDPEDMQDVIRTYQNAVSGEVVRFEGHVAKFMGDGALAYFGWPTAHEDSGERAVQAALSIVRGMVGLATPLSERLRVRIGISTGLVVVGDLIGEGASREEAVVGETPNIAARLQAIASPDQVVISQTTRGLLGGLFELVDLGPQELKGVSQPIQAYAVQRQREIQSRFNARQTGDAVPIVGREQELALLLERWRRAKDEEGQAVLLSGEAGIGKSRIVSAVIDSLAEVDHLRIRYQCSPYHQDSPFWPVIQQLTYAAGIALEDTTASRLEKLEHLLGQAVDDPGEAVPVLASLLGVEDHAGTAKPERTPQELRKLTLDALLKQLAGLAKSTAVLWIVEDIHWIDPTTLEFIELALDRIAENRVLLLITARPTIRLGFVGHPVVTQLMLNRLSREHILNIVNSLTRGRVLPDVLLREIVAKTDGVPLFVEELTKTIIESDLLRRTESAYVFEGDPEALSIPTSLHDSLMARLDRLRPVKEVAQAAACIGREFSYRLLRTVLPLGDPELDAALESLIDAALVFRRGTAMDANYLFKHALVRDAAYESLLKRQRRALHARIARSLEADFPETTENQPEVVADHFTKAGLADAAIDYWRRAGELATNRSANREAIRHFRRGLDAISSLPLGEERLRREIPLQIGLIGPHIAVEGYGAEKTAAIIARALELCRQFPDRAEMFPVLYGQYAFHLVAGTVEETHVLAEEFLDFARRREDDSLVMVGHRLIGTTYFLRGQTAAARKELEASLRLYDDERHAHLTSQYAQDFKVGGISNLIVALLHAGYPDQARAGCSELLTRLNSINHANSIGYGTFFVCLTHALGWDREALDSAVTLLTIHATEHMMPLWDACARYLRGLVVAIDGHPKSATEALQSGLTSMDSLHFIYWRPTFLGWLAQVHLQAGRPRDGLAILANAFQTVDKRKETWFLPELHRLRGEMRLVEAGVEEEKNAAAADFAQSIKIAREHGGKLFELRAAKSMARLLLGMGASKKANEVLKPVYGSFTEGFETSDLKDARALLAELS